MSTFTTSLARLARLTRGGRAIAVPLLVAGVLAAGCGTQHATAAGSAGQAGAARQPSAHATGSQQPAPVPTVTGGAVAAGEPACADWPVNVPHVMMPALFVPVAVERCVTSIQTIAGKGQWETATLEKATTGLAPLIAALRHPSVTRTPDMICPDLAMLPPQIVLISGSGQKLMPLLPVGGCGLVQSAVLAAINTLPWQPVSVRLVAPVASEVPAATTPTATEVPKTVQNVPGMLSQ